MDLPKKYFSISEAAQRLGVSISTLRRWEREGKISIGRTPGGKRLFSEEDLKLLTSPIRTEIGKKRIHFQIPSISARGGSLFGRKLPPKVLLLTTLLIIALAANFYLLSLTTLPHQAVLGVETFIAPVIAEEGPIGGLISKAGSFFSAIGRSAFGGKGGSFVVPLLGKSELATSGDLRVTGKGTFAKDIESLGNLKIKGTATVGRLITGIVDPYLIENDGSFQSTLEIKSAGDILLNPLSGNVNIQGSETLGGNLTLSSSSPVISIGNSGTLKITDGTNTLLKITDNGTSGNLEDTGDLKVGGNITLTGVINSNTFTSTKLTFAGSSPSITAGTTNTGISLNGNGTGAINIGNSSKGDIYLGGGSTTGTYCLITNSSASLNCSSDITSGGNFIGKNITIRNIQAEANALYDIGTSGTRFRNAYLSGTLTIGSSTTTIDTSGLSTGTVTASSITGTGQLSLTRAPSSVHTGTWAIGSSTWNQSDATIYVNASSATADSNLLGLAVGGSVKFAVDAEGDAYVNNLILAGNITSATTTVSGDLTVEGNTTLGDATTDTLTINPATLTLAGGNKTIDITGAATRTLTILNSTASQIADLDLSDGSLKTGGTSRLTNAGVLQNITGLTVSSGTVSLPNDQIDPSEITQGTAGQLLLSNATPDTAWTTLSGDATLAGTGALTLASTGVTAASYGGATAVPVLTIDAKGRVTAATTASISSAWSALTLPAADLSLSMGAYTSTFAYSATTGTQTQQNTTNSASSGTTTVNSLGVALTGTDNASGTNTINGINFANVTAKTNNTFNVLNIGTGYNNIIVSGNVTLTAAGALTVASLTVNGTISSTSTVTGTQLISNVATGTAPLTVTSTTQVTNLNASTLAGNTAATISPVVDVQTFTANGTWTKPTNTKWVRVVVIGAGGSGGGGYGLADGNTRTGGGGGGGGAIVIRDFDPSVLGATETVTVAASLSGGANQTNGSTGGTSSFGSHVSAYGGGGGQGDTIPQKGGGGGGAAVNGQAGSSGGAGGDPGGAALNASASAFGGAGAGYNVTGSGAAVYGGGGGGAPNWNAGTPTTGIAGGQSLYGGGGGGGGGSVTNANSPSAGAAGGAYGGYSTGGGGAAGGATGAAGTIGTSRSGTGKAGDGGGGGGGLNGGTGGVGGAGGAPGGGGGGGGAGTTGGVGGAGGRGEVIVYSIGKNTLADLAEEYRISDTSIEAGDVVKLVNDPQINDSTLVGKTNKGYDGEVLGVISTDPAIILGDSYPYLVNINFSDLDKYKNTNLRPVALSGRVPVKVTSENGVIRRGDILTSSDKYPGFAMKATRAGRSIGTAMEDFSPTISINQQTSASISGFAVGKIMTFVNLSFYDPDVYLADNGQFVVQKKEQSQAIATLSANGLIQTQPQTQTPKYELANTQTKEVIERTGGYNNLFVANLKVGSLDVSEITSPDLRFKIDDLGIKIASLSARIKNLELATSSAVLSASISGLLNSEQEASNSSILSSLTVQGRTILNDLGITGKISSGLLSIDGLSSSINSLGNDLYLQNNLLGGINFLNGKILIDKEGNLKTIGEILAKKYKVDVSDISSTSLGSGVLIAGTTSITIATSAVTDGSKIFITPVSDTDKPLMVKNKLLGKSFDVTILAPYISDIHFDWFIVN